MLHWYGGGEGVILGLGCSANIGRGRLSRCSATLGEGVILGLWGVVLH